MTESVNSEDNLVLISALEKYVVCPRQCALIFVEGIWSDNIHTITGTILHERADVPGYENVGVDDVKILRALPLFSKKYGLTGKADVVEIRGTQPVPIEYKKGRRKQWDNDDIQLCAQALCLEEMFATHIPKGYIFHITSKKRREVIFDDELRAETCKVIAKVRQMLSGQHVPPAILKPQCEGCSLHEICLPELDVAKKNDDYLWRD